MYQAVGYLALTIVLLFVCDSRINTRNPLVCVDAQGGIDAALGQRRKESGSSRGIYILAGQAVLIYLDGDGPTVFQSHVDIFVTFFLVARSQHLQAFSNSRRFPAEQGSRNGG